jgi:large subunit ribosomal protein L18
MTKIALRQNKTKRELRVKKKVFGDAGRPRLTIFRSNRFISGQIIDDVAGKTIVDIQSEARKLHGEKAKAEAAFEVGKELAKKALEKKISQVVFDRKSYRYHGRVRRFAEGAREGGLQF